MSLGSVGTGRVAVAAWLLLMLSVAAWLHWSTGIGRVFTAIAFLPLLLPLPGLLGRSSRALRAAPLALAPVLTLAPTEILANPPARPWAGLSLALVLAAFAALIAAIRTAPRP